MRKYLLILFLCLLPVLVFADAAVIGEVGLTIPAAAGGGTDFTQDANCRGAWMFLAGDPVDDASGEDNDLVATNVDAGDYTATRPSVHSGGSSSQSVQLDGVEERFDLAWEDMNGDFPGFTAAGEADWAISFWFKHDDDGNTEYMFTVEWNWSIWLGSDEAIDWSQKEEGASTHTWTDIHDVTGDANWYHVVFSFDGSDTEGTTWVSSEAAFGDQLNGTTETFTDVDDCRGSNHDFTIGSIEGGANYFDGFIYQPIIFDRELSAAEATELYNTGVVGSD